MRGLALMTQAEWLGTYSVHSYCRKATKRRANDSFDNGKQVEVIRRMRHLTVNAPNQKP